MPPNVKEIQIKLEYSPQDALPYNEPRYKRRPDDLMSKTDPAPTKSSPSETSEGDVDDNEEDSGTRITTKARYTYELDRYAKNAMLLLSNMGTIHENDTKRDLIGTFQKYRFEVDTYDNLKREDILSVCAKFFDRDFTDYGAVAVVILTRLNNQGQLFADGGFYSESDILKYFNADTTPTLKGKPKLYITEFNSFTRRQRNHFDSVEDVLTFTMPVPIVRDDHPLYHPKFNLRPLQIVCRNIVQHSDKRHMFDIVNKSIGDIIITWGFYKNFPIFFTSTLRKELHLAETIL